MKRIAAVVVTYNRIKLLQECIAALCAQDVSNYDIVIVDNASNDGTREWIEELTKEQRNQPECHPQIFDLLLTENLGGAGGFHYGMKWAVEQGYDYIWIMDDDTIPRPDALRQMLAGIGHIPEESFGFASSTVLWTDGTPCEMNQQHVLPASTEKDKKLQEAYAILPVDQATFVSLLFPADVVRKMGLPLKEYFIWGDDKEYTLRLAAKYPCYQISDSVVIHKMSQNTGSNITYDKVERISRYYYAYRNDYCTARKQGVKAVLIYWAAFVLNVMRILLLVRRERKYALIRCGVG